MLYQLSYQANWGLATLWPRNIPVEGEEYKWTYENLIPFRPEFFQALTSELLSCVHNWDDLSNLQKGVMQETGVNYHEEISLISSLEIKIKKFSYST